MSVVLTEHPSQKTTDITDRVSEVSGPIDFPVNQQEGKKNLEEV
jgi:hypothetical protein